MAIVIIVTTFLFGGNSQLRISRAKAAGYYSAARMIEYVLQQLIIKVYQEQLLSKVLLRVISDSEGKYSITVPNTIFCHFIHRNGNTGNR